MSILPAGKVRRKHIVLTPATRRAALRDHVELLLIEAWKTGGPQLAVCALVVATIARLYVRNERLYERLIDSAKREGRPRRQERREEDDDDAHDPGWSA